MEVKSKRNFSLGDHLTELLAGVVKYAVGGDISRTCLSEKTI